MSERILITGCAGFIGRIGGRELRDRGYEVRVLDSLIGQVQGGGERPEGLDDMELLVVDICDASCVRRALANVDAVIHLAAEVGVGQSMYAITRYTATNELGTATLFEQLLEQPVRRVVTESSMSIYGDGLYRSAAGRLFGDFQRTAATGGGWGPGG